MPIYWTSDSTIRSLTDRRDAFAAALSDTTDRDNFATLVRALVDVTDELSAAQAERMPTASRRGPCAR